MRRTLLRAVRSGSWADLRRRTVDAGHLRDLCRSPELVDPRGLMVRRARVTGRLDLSGIEVPFPLRFEECQFAETPLLDAIDTVVPLVSLGQRATWYPDAHSVRGGFMSWFLNIDTRSSATSPAATLLGWVLSSVLVFSFARLARSV